MITSTKNDQVKAVIELKKKARARNEQGLFVVEGVRMAAELPKDQVKSIYVSETFAKNPENAAILTEYPGYELVSNVRYTDASGCAGTCQTIFLWNGGSFKE